MSNLDIKSAQLVKKQQRIRDNWPDIDRFNGVFVFPYELRSGYLNRTEKGYVWDDSNVNNYNFFQKLITGKDNINVVWSGSTRLIKPRGENAYYYDFKVGSYYLGSIVGNTLNAETQFYDDDLNHRNIKVNNTVVLHFVYNEENDYEKYFPELRPFMVEKADLFKLYKIPQLFGEEWMYISNVNYETIPETKQIVGCFITFVSLNEQLSKSGQTLEGYIHESSPNEPYAKPLITEIKDEKGEMVPACVLSGEEQAITAPRVKYIQIEIFGTNALTAINIVGREIKEQKDENSSYKGKLYFNTWQFLYPCKLVKPKTYGLEKTNTPSNNFYIFPRCHIEFTKSVNWIEQWKKISDVVATNNFTGVLFLGDVGDYSITKPHFSNVPINGTHIDFYNSGWLPFSNNAKDIDINIALNGACYSTESLKLETTDSFIDILVKNSFIYLQQLELPLDFSSSKPYKMSNFPIINGILPALFGDRTLQSNLSRKSTIPICCIIDCAAATCASNLLIGNEIGKNIPLSFFGGQEVPKYLGVETCNTSLCFSLTKWMVDKNGKKWDTMYLGQNTNEKGEALLDEGETFLYDGTQKTTEEGEETFVIDKVLIQGLIKGKIRLTFFGEDGPSGEPLWTTTISSTAEFTNSIRNWTTEINTGCWNGKYITQEAPNEKFTWPKNPPFAIDYGYPRDKKKTFNIDENHELTIHINKNEYRTIGTSDDEGSTWLSDFFSAWKRIGSSQFTINYSDFPPEWRITNKEDFLSKVSKISFNFNCGWSLQSFTGGNNRIQKDYYSQTFDFIPKKERDSTLFKLFNYDGPKDSINNEEGFRFVYWSPDNRMVIQPQPFGTVSGGGWVLSCKCDNPSDFNWYRKCWMFADEKLECYSITNESITIEFKSFINFVRAIKLDDKPEKLYFTFFYEGAPNSRSLGGDLHVYVKLNKITFFVNLE